MKNSVAIAVIAGSLIGCGSSPPPMTQEQIEAQQRQWAREKEERKQRRIDEARALGLLDMSEGEQVEYLRGFLMRTRGGVNCGTVTNLGYYDANFHVIRCINGSIYLAGSGVSGSEIFLTPQERAMRSFGFSVDEVVWFIGDDASN